MALTIDNLEIQVEAEASNATRGLNRLAKSLEKLKTAVGDTSGLASNLTQISSALKTFNGVGKINLTAKINQLNKLQGLIPTLGGSDATQMANNLRDISSALMAFSAIPKFNVNVSSVAKAITDLNTATASFDPARLTQFASQMQGIAGGLSVLSGVGKSNIGSTVNALKKIPEITATLDPSTIQAFGDAVARLVEIMTPLGIQMDAVARGFDALPNSIKRAIKATDQAVGSNVKASLSFKDLMKPLKSYVERLKKVYNTVKKIADLCAGAFSESNEYIEAMNLFTVSMGDAKNAAMEYAEVVSAAMGIDVAEWIAKQGTFMRTMVGFGVVEEEAETMSRNLTQLGYDLASFFNVSTEEAFDKLQSGMTGQIKGLKDYGLNLSVAALQETAYRLGLEQSVRTMTEAQKAQLRYITLLQNSNGILGDMAKTILTPANSLRVLNAQIERAKRAWGNLVSVIAVKIIPWVMALVEMLEELGTALAEAMGFELPELPENDLKISADTDELEAANEEAEKLKKQLMGFDELNILQNNKDEDNKTPSYSLGIELPEYDFLNGLKGIDLEPIKRKLKEILNLVKYIGAALLAWKVSDGIAKFLGGLFTDGALNKDALKGLKIKAGLTLMVTGLTLEYDGAYGLGYEGANLKNVLKTAIGAALGIGGSLLLFGTGPLGWTVGIGLALTVGITGFALGYNKKKLEEEMQRRFGDIVLDTETALELAQKLTTSKLTLALDIYVEEAALLESIEKQVSSAVGKLEKDKIRIALGLEVSQEEYQTDIDALLKSVNDYIDQKEVTMAMSIDILFGEDSEVGEGLTSSATSILEGYKEELRTKGEELKGIIAEGFSEGEWIPDKYKEAQKLQEEIQEIYSYLADVDFRTAVAEFDVEYGASALTPESMAEVANAAQAAIEKQMESFEKVRREALAAAVLTYDENVELLGKAEAKKIYDNTVAQIQDEFNKKKFEVYAEFGKFTFGSLSSDMFKEEMAKVMENPVWEPSKEVQKVAKQMLEPLKPTIEDYNEIIASYNAMGQKIPESIADGIREVKQLERLAGSTEAMYYLIGESVGRDFEALKQTLFDPEKAKMMASSWMDGMAEGLKGSVTVVQGAAKGTIDIISDTFGTKTIELTEEVKESLQALGITIHGGLEDIKEDVGKIDVFGKLKGALKTGWEKIVTWWGELELPDLNLNPNTKFGTSQKGVAQFASGGFPTTGQMFIAREAGPELVGRIGNKTAVANNDQITAGIASAVYSAMMAANEDGNSGNGSNARIVVQIGDRAVGEAAVRFINGQIVQTGTNPIYA